MIIISNIYVVFVLIFETRLAISCYILYITIKFCKRIYILFILLCTPCRYTLRLKFA